MKTPVGPKPPGGGTAPAGASERSSEQTGRESGAAHRGADFNDAVEGLLGDSG